MSAALPEKMLLVETRRFALSGFIDQKDPELGIGQSSPAQRSSRFFEPMEENGRAS